MPEEQEAKKEPNIEALRYRYEELREERKDQKESWEKEGEHNRRMFRLLLIFTGLIITGLSTGQTGSYSSALFDQPHCAVYSGPNCIQTNYLLFIGIMLLAASSMFYIKGATGGLLIGAPRSEFEEHSNEEETPPNEFENEEEYLQSRIESLNQDLTTNYEKHRSQKLSERAGAAALFFSMSSFLLLGVALAQGSAIEEGPFWIAIFIITAMIFVVEWDIMQDFPPIRYIRKLWGE